MGRRLPLWGLALLATAVDGLQASAPVGITVYDGVFASEACAALSQGGAAVLSGQQHQKHRVFSRRAKVGTALEAALASFLAEVGDESEWVEYWSRSEWKHIEAHADVDEALVGQTGRLRFPNHGHVLATAVGDRVHGPTCVLSADEGTLYTVPPKPGRVLRFDGTLVHAVPKPHDVWLRPFVTSERYMPDHIRAVILFNTWDDRPVGVLATTSDDEEEDPTTTTTTTTTTRMPFAASALVAEPFAAWRPCDVVHRDGGGTLKVKLPFLGNDARRGHAPRFRAFRAAASLGDALCETTRVVATPLLPVDA